MTDAAPQITIRYHCNGDELYYDGRLVATTKTRKDAVMLARALAGLERYDELTTRLALAEDTLAQINRRPWWARIFQTKRTK